MTIPLLKISKLLKVRGARTNRRVTSPFSTNGIRRRSISSMYSFMYSYDAPSGPLTNTKNAPRSSFGAYSPGICSISHWVANNIATNTRPTTHLARNAPLSTAR